MFHSKFKYVVIGSLKSFFQLDHHVDVSLYFNESLFGIVNAMGGRLSYVVPYF
jgi:hypothetical protein